MKGWKSVETPDGVRYLRFAPLEEAGIRHLFTLRPREGGSPRSRPGGRELLPELPEGLPLARSRQVHGGTVSVPSPDGPGTQPPEADAVVVDKPGVAAAVATADCVGGILAAPGSSCFAVVHAGWRGVVEGVIGETVSRLQLASGVAPERMVLATGPSARRCCYEVGAEVLEPFARLFGEARWERPLFGSVGGSPGGSPGGRRTVEPAAAVGHQAEMAGLRRESIHHVDLCTMCRPDLCWSYRIQGNGAGRMLAAAVIA